MVALSKALANGWACELGSQLDGLETKTTVLAASRARPRGGLPANGMARSESELRQGWTMSSLRSRKPSITLCRKQFLQWLAMEELLDFRFLKSVVLSLKGFDLARPCARPLTQSVCPTSTLMMAHIRRYDWRFGGKLLILSLLR